MENLSTVYEAIIKPLIPLLKKEAEQLKKDDYKLSITTFTLNLCYCVIAGIKSLRLLSTEAKTSDTAQKHGVVIASSSQYSEAFQRYDPAIFKRLFFKLLNQLSFKSIPELNTLGRFVLVDGSLFPAIKTMDWAKYKSTSNALKLHLAFGLNRMIPVQFICTEGNGSEKKMLRDILEEGVTYIADRGYVAFDLFKQIVDQSAFFIIRVNSNMQVITQKSVITDLPTQWKYHLDNITDHHIIFKGDSHAISYRLITFEALGECYRIATNRFDLKTHEIIMLYAYRWQIELFFRCIKRCFNSLHLWSHEAKGIEIQFYLYMIVYLLIINFKQVLQDKADDKMIVEDKQQEKASYINRLNKNGITRTPACGIVTLLGNELKKVWKISIHWLVALKNMLSKPLSIQVIKILNSY